jgi:peptidyl-prolyl cis-trans isomerase C
VKRYFDANRARYDSPERINVWRILCKSKDEAITVLDAAKKDSTIANFTGLAREHSLDKATSMRGGNLGFLAPDGTSNEAGLKVDPLVVRAAQRLKDGELAPLPIPEGEYFGVVWRRGTVAASRRTVEEVAGQIRDLLWKEKKEQAEKKLLDDLRARDVSQLNPALIDTIEISTSDGAILPHKRPGQVPPLQPTTRPSK